MDALNLFEIGILDFIRETFSCKFLDYFFIAITSLSDEGIFWIILAVVLLCFKKTTTFFFLGILMGLFFSMNWNKSHVHNPYYRSKEIILLGDLFNNLIIYFASE